MIADKKILIVGAGPVGLACAIELTRRGARPRIIDQNDGPNPNSRALAVNARTLDLMGPSGVAKTLLAAGHRLHRAVIREGASIKARFNFNLIPHRYNFLLVLPQHDTEVIFEKHLAGMGITVERKLGIASLMPGDRPKVTFNNGTSDDFDFVMGCDGAHSVVRKALGITYPGESEPDALSLSDVTLDNWPFDDDTAVITFMPDFAAPYIPMGDTKSGVSSGRFITTVPDCLHNLPPDAKIKQVIWDTDFRISYRQADTYQNGHCFIVGDAAHIHSPVGGRGMNLGVEDACWLAWLMSEGNESQYTAQRHPVGKQVLGFTQSFTKIARGHGWARALVIRAGLPLLAHLPFVQRKVFYMLSAQDTPFPPWLPQPK